MPGGRAASLAAAAALVGGGARAACAEDASGGPKRHWFSPEFVWEDFSKKYPSAVRSSGFWDQSCDFSPSSVNEKLFKIENKQDLRDKGILVDISFSLVAVLTFAVYFATLLLSYWALPENPLGDMATWTLFGNEPEALDRRMELHWRMRQVGITRQQFFEALPKYRSGLEKLADAHKEELFDFLAAGDKMLIFESFSQVRLVPPFCGWAKEWINRNGERWGKENEVLHGITYGPRNKDRVRPVKVIHGSFRPLTDRGERAWFALQVAAGNWERIASGDFSADDNWDSSSSCSDDDSSGSKESIPSRASSDLACNDWNPSRTGGSLVGVNGLTRSLAPLRLDADWGFPTDPRHPQGRAPTLQDFILQRFDPNQPMHSRMRVCELLPPCQELPCYEGNRNPRRWIANKDKAYSYLMAALAGPCKVAGAQFYLPYSVHTGIVIFIAQALVGAFVESTKAENFLLWSLSDHRYWWSYFFGSRAFWLTFKPELWLYVLYTHGRLLLVSIRLLALSGVNVLTLRNSYGRDLLGQLRGSLLSGVALVPVALSLLICFAMLPFAPVLTMFALIWIATIRPLDRVSHHCLTPCRTPYFTTAPLLTLIIMWPICFLITNWKLPNTFLCNWSQFEIVGNSTSRFVDVVQHLPSKDHSLSQCLSSGIAIAICFLAIFGPISWCATSSTLVQWLLLRLTYRWWLEQSEPLLCFLHDGSKGQTAQFLTYSFVQSFERPTCPRCVPRCIREPVEELAERLDNAFPGSSLSCCWRNFAWRRSDRWRVPGYCTSCDSDPNSAATSPWTPSLDTEEYVQSEDWRSLENDVPPSVR